MNTTLYWLTTAFNGLVAFVPRLIGGLVILIVGYLVARVLQSVTRSLSRRLGLERLVARLRIGSPTSDAASTWTGKAVFVVVMLAAFLQTARVWDLGFVAAGLATIIAYLPRALAACVIFAVALFAGNYAHDRLARRERLNGTIRFLPSIVRGVIVAVGVFMVLRELDFAADIVNAAFIITLSGIAVGAAIAFGVGGRGVAAKVLESWYEQRRRASGEV